MSEINIIIHGFGGNPGELAYLTDFIRTKGLNTHVVTLAGHGGTRKQLAATNHEDWIQSVKIEIKKLMDSYDKINLVGFSMGGLIAVNMVSIFGKDKIGKVVFINTPIYFWNLKIIAKDVLGNIAGRRKGKISYYVNAASKTGIKSGINFLKIRSQTKRLLKNAKGDYMPVSLILQCTHDESVRYKSAKYLKAKLGPSAHLKCYEGGCHQVFARTLHLRDIVCDDICNFIRHSK